MTKRLTYRQVGEIRAYLRAHTWRGAQAAIAKKYGVSQQTVTHVKKGDYYK